MSEPRQKPASELAAPLSADMLALQPGALWRAFRAEHFGFICIAAYLLLEYLKPEQAYPIFAIVPLLKLSLLGAIAGFFVDRSAKVPGAALSWLLLLFLVQCFLSAMNAYDSDFAFERMNIIVTWVVVYFLIIALVNTERRLYLFLMVYFLANFKMSQFGFFSWVNRGFGFASWGITGAGWFRNSGELGLQMTMFFAYTAAFFIFLRKYWSGWRKWLMYFLSITALCCVVASSSRGAMVATVAVLVALSFFSKYRVRAWVATAVILGLLYYLMPPEFIQRFQNAGTDATSLSRIAYWARAREMLAENPVFGVGYYNWIPYYRDHFFDPSLYWRVEEAHNTYLQLGAELGYVGLGLFVVMVLASFLVNARSASRSKAAGFEFLRTFAIGMNVAGLGMIIASFFLTAFFMPNYWIHFALTVALSAIVNRRLAQADVKQELKPGVDARVPARDAARPRAPAR